MKRKAGEIGRNELRSEYDFSSMAGRVKGKYSARYKAGGNLIHLDPDVAAVFQGDESVNDGYCQEESACSCEIKIVLAH
jgi:hypothetical protein